MYYEWRGKRRQAYDAFLLVPLFAVCRYGGKRFFMADVVFGRQGGAERHLARLPDCLYSGSIASEDSAFPLQRQLAHAAFRFDGAPLRPFCTHF